MIPPARLRYFNGRLLSADDLQTEQDYFLGKHRRQNLLLHGSGIVHGLRVAPEGAGVRVSPGAAIDAHGNEIIVAQTTRVPFPAATGSGFALMLRYTETQTRPVPDPQGDDSEYSRIEEGFTLEFVPSAIGLKDALTLATVENSGRGWRVTHAASSKPNRASCSYSVFVVGFLCACLGRMLLRSKG